ncbi:putative hydrophobic protein (TIGR00271 family) [Glycomyces artemisiae]|uniref:Putative hydrophobic protein (TIGR00271 family) n=1 Tax=Glycomyces artemisiae TaxID=1076443 RepID=A0A2T0UPI4_9ACTN|nr:putative hydrophobic protein (TIGR00271 family) [Glycomyces artemisiae]
MGENPLVLHVRVITPAALAPEVLKTAVDCHAVANVVRLPGAAVDPAGDCIEFDVAREGANEILADLRAMGLKETGAITIEEIDLSISDGADEAEAAAPGHSEDAVIWEELAARTSAETRLTWSYLVFLALAVQIAAIGALLDQPILIVGAMVLGPDFGPVAAFCFGVMQRDLPLIGRAARTLAVGFAVAIAVTLACAAASRLVGWIEPTMLDDRPLTSFIIHPDRWSFIVAVLAGVAGILSMTARKSQALVGVFISVTTVPAAGNIAVAIALAHWDEVGASLVQLGVNLAGLVVAGIGTLLVQRFLWSRFELGLNASAMSREP